MSTTDLSNEEKSRILRTPILTGGNDPDQESPAEAEFREKGRHQLEDIYQMGFMPDMPWDSHEPDDETIAEAERGQAERYEREQSAQQMEDLQLRIAELQEQIRDIENRPAPVPQNSQAGEELAALRDMLKELLSRPQAPNIMNVSVPEQKAPVVNMHVNIPKQGNRIKTARTDPDTGEIVVEERDAD